MNIRAEKFRFYPTQSQANMIEMIFSCVRFVWNKHTALFNSYTSNCGPNHPGFTIKELKALYPFLCEIPYTPMEQKKCDFVETKSQFFNKKRKVQLGRMKFKKRGVAKDSFRLSTNVFNIKNNELTICAKTIGKLKIQRNIDLSKLQNATSVTVSKNKIGQYFISVLYRTEIQQLPKTGKSIGIDLGLKTFYSDSNGEAVAIQKHFRKSQAKLKRAQRSLSCKKKGSKNYEKQRLSIAKIHLKIANQRKHFLHVTSYRLIKNNDIICLEDLNIKGMMKNRRLAKSIADASWSLFNQFLTYKANWHDRKIVKIGRFYPSSKLCSTDGCDFKHQSLPLSVRVWTCPSCNVEHDRDTNAAKNILNEGLKILRL